MKTILKRAAIDGGIRAVVLFALVIFWNSVFAARLFNMFPTSDTYIRILEWSVVLGAVICAVIYLFLLRKVPGTKNKIKFTALSILFFVIGSVVLDILLVIGAFRFIPLAVAYGAEFIIMLIEDAIFVVASFVLRVIILVASIVKGGIIEKNIEKGQNNETNI